MKSLNLDRSAIEELFQLQRRAAIDLMAKAGAEPAKRGEASLVSRASLLAWTEATAKEETWQLRRQKDTSEELSRSMAEVRAIREALVKENRPPVSFPVVEEVLSANCSSLPSSIRIEHGRITIAVPDGPAQQMSVAACQLLYELGLAIANDAAGFEARLAAGESDLISSLQSILHGDAVRDEDDDKQASMQAT
jgi:hypothetical protein